MLVGWRGWTGGEGGRARCAEHLYHGSSLTCLLRSAVASGQRRHLWSWRLNQRPPIRQV